MFFFGRIIPVSAILPSDHASDQVSLALVDPETNEAEIVCEPRDTERLPAASKEWGNSTSGKVVYLLRMALVVVFHGNPNGYSMLQDML